MPEERLAALEERMQSLEGRGLPYPVDINSLRILEDWFSSRTNGIYRAGSQTVSPRLFHTGGLPAQVNTDETDQWPVITEVYFCELFLPCNFNPTGLAVLTLHGKNNSQIYTS